MIVMHGHAIFLSILRKNIQHDWTKTMLLKLDKTWLCDPVAPEML